MRRQGQTQQIEAGLASSFLTRSARHESLPRAHRRLLAVYSDYRFFLCLRERDRTRGQPDRESLSRTRRIGSCNRLGDDQGRVHQPRCTRWLSARACSAKRIGPLTVDRRWVRLTLERDVQELLTYSTGTYTARTPSASRRPDRAGSTLPSSLKDSASEKTIETTYASLAVFVVSDAATLGSDVDQTDDRQTKVHVVDSGIAAPPHQALIGQARCARPVGPGRSSGTCWRHSSSVNSLGPSHVDGRDRSRRPLANTRRDRGRSGHQGRQRPRTRVEIKRRARTTGRGLHRPAGPARPPGRFHGHPGIVFYTGNHSYTHRPHPRLPKIARLWQRWAGHRPPLTQRHLQAEQDGAALGNAQPFGCMWSRGRDRRGWADALFTRCRSHHPVLSCGRVRPGAFGIGARDERRHGFARGTKTRRRA